MVFCAVNKMKLIFATVCLLVASAIAMPVADEAPKPVEPAVPALGVVPLEKSAVEEKPLEKPQEIKLEQPMAMPTEQMPAKEELDKKKMEEDLKKKNPEMPMKKDEEMKKKEDEDMKKKEEMLKPEEKKPELMAQKIDSKHAAGEQHQINQVKEHVHHHSDNVKQAHEHPTEIARAHESVQHHHLHQHHHVSPFHFGDSTES